MFKINDSTNVVGTSFHGNTIKVKPIDIIETFGSPISDNSLEDKVQLEWFFSKGNRAFTLYDYKEYRDYDYTELIEFHIGSKSPELENDFKEWLLDKINN